MKRIAIFLFLSVAAIADDSKYATATLDNGRSWAVREQADRLNYASGMLDMLSIYLVADPKDADRYSVHATVGEIIKSIDKFYDDPANADVPIVLSLIYVKARVEGATATQLEDAAAGLRAVASALNKTTPKSSN